MVASQEDLNTIDFYCAAGSMAYTADFAEIWQMNADGEWTVLASGSGGAGGGLPEGGEPYKALVTDASGNTVWEDRLAWKESGTILDEKVPEVTVDFADGYFYEDYYSKSPEDTDLLSRMEFYDATENIIAYWDGVFYKCHFSETLGSGSGAEDKYVPEGTDAFFFTVVAAAAPVVIYSKDNGVHTFRLGIGGSTEVVHTIAPEYIGGWDNVGSKGYVSLIKEQTVTFADMGGMNGATLDGDEPTADVIGKHCTVRIDDASYACTVGLIEDMVFIGNLSLMTGGTDTGEPFLIVAQGIWQIGSTLEAGEHTVEVVVADVEKIPTQYLPAGFVRKIVFEGVVHSTGSGADWNQSEDWDWTCNVSYQQFSEIVANNESFFVNVRGAFSVNDALKMFKDCYVDSYAIENGNLVVSFALRNETDATYFTITLAADGITCTRNS